MLLFLDFVPVGLGSPASPGADKGLSSCLVSQSGWYGGVREVVDLGYELLLMLLLRLWVKEKP